MGNYSLGIALCFFVQQSSAYIYEVRVVRRTLPGTTQEKQYIVGLSDFHDRSQPHVASEQRQMLEKLLKTADSRKIRFFVEDLSSPNCDGTCSCANYRVNTRGGFLGGITALIKSYGCCTDNLEFRYCRVVALGLTAAGRASKQARALQEAIKLEQFVKETHSLLGVINHYQDCGMGLWYRSCTQTVEDAMNRLSLVGCQKQTVGEYVRAASQKRRGHDRVLEELLSYDSPLFDARLVHEILNDTQHKTLVVIAGGTHVQEAFDVLVKSDYEQIPLIQECLPSSSVSARSGVDVTPTQKNNFALPRPIALSCSKRFWPQRNY